MTRDELAEFLEDLFPWLPRFVDWLARTLDRWPVPRAGQSSSPE